MSNKKYPFRNFNVELKNQWNEEREIININKFKNTHADFTVFPISLNISRPTKKNRFIKMKRSLDC